MSLPHVAFRASPELTASTQAYLDHISNPRNKPDPVLLGAVMNDFTRDSIHAFMLNPVRELGITGTQRKLVDFMAETAQKSSAMVLKATLHKLDHEQHKRSAEYMDSLRLLLPHEERIDGIWYVSFPADTQFALRARAAIAHAREHGPQANLQETAYVMKVLTDLALQNYYEKPLALLNFGMILSKVSEVAISAVRKGAYATIDSLFPKLSEAQLIKGVDYFDSMLINVPPEHIRTPIKL